MTTLRPMLVEDFFHFNGVNLDHFTETFNMDFYLSYLNKWPECCVVAEAVDGSIAGYIIGKVEGNGKDWHAHVSAVTVAPEYRRTGVANQLMEYLEEVGDKTHNAYFCDLFVRPSNEAAILFYKKLGYVVYRTVTGYYCGDTESSSEDAYDMRKPMPRDKEGRSIQGAGKRISPHEIWA
mmetsp:Transcript_61335/g.134392  ORF Transcript_61335/g.134392 Transcript_61335/m.134392 type:complete len:179 (-) Transcript_61335:27-563(-)|eukprot:CAMPEP_0206488178 /NCGR_PEP_ID=MMETSP0324_2-20121206/42207_1 /ASSEMBLY_ACC=CAM_ASM_000836 /TAXON_ID=2866 /ORGANISM="Crypthecodinium cohnii, Strain Seligo" /LENGTH=178 /DNA_ID=CAMNT_0053967051 /DNA_START=26 /DNA_END=559 /DNA_ORIENTATION=+